MAAGRASTAEGHEFDAHLFRMLDQGVRQVTAQQRREVAGLGPASSGVATSLRERRLRHFVAELSGNSFG